MKFQLHSFILMQHSAWFRDNLNINPDVSNPIWYAYSIERNANGARLARRDVQGNCPLIQNQKLDSNAQPIVKLEHCHVGELSDNADQAMVQCERPIASTELPNDLSDVGFYQKVFAAFYNIRPQLCQTDIGVTLIQAEGLAKIAGELGCLHLIRADISFALSQYGKKLFVNIRFDPPRWICLGMALEDSLIYKEALIHIVGAHPRWPWRRSERSMLPPELHTLIAMKSKILDQMCLEADRDLMLLTIEVGGHPVSFNNGKTMETWLLVQIFRDQLAALLRSQRGSDDWALKRGKLYRKFHKGGSAYMDYENVQRQCKRLFGLADWSELGDDLKNLKQYASAIVERLAKNELMLDLEEPSKIGYLTCVDIQKEDIPFPSSV